MRARIEIVRNRKVCELAHFEVAILLLNQSLVQRNVMIMITHISDLFWRYANLMYITIRHSIPSPLASLKAYQERWYSRRLLGASFFDISVNHTTLRLSHVSVSLEVLFSLTL